MNERINIRVYKDAPGTSVAAIKETEKKKDSSKQSSEQKAITTALLNAGKQVISQGIQQYTKLSGNSGVTNALNYINETALIVGEIVFGGPVGMIAAGITVTSKITNAAVELVEEKRSLTFLNQGLGKIQTYGNRGEY
jgi:hypothetical protein